MLTHSAVNHNNKKRKRSPLLVALIIIIMLLLVLLTLAFFTSFDEVTNAFEGGRVDIVLKEENWNPQNAKKIVPGKVLDKDPKIMTEQMCMFFWRSLFPMTILILKARLLLTKAQR